jgi:putative hydrolase of HD superfamily
MAHQIEFFLTISKLKQVARAGWVLRGLSNVESVADHSWRMAVMAMTLSPSEHSAKRIKMALVHDLAELIVGDLTPEDNVPKAEKQRLEREAMVKICRAEGSGAAFEEILELWEEYEAGESEDAKFLKDIDKLEMILQADEYERNQGADLQEFFDSTEGKWMTQEIAALAEVLTKSRIENTKSDK